ncbi:MAG: RP439 family protein [Rickettsia sp.]
MKTLQLVQCCFECIAQILDIKPTSLVGAGTVYEFYNSQYELPKELIPEDYHFVGAKGMLLFGDYQFGGHRYFKDQLVFGPEDCSSSVGKATYLTTEQVRGINTTQMRENYSQYGYKLVTTLDSNTSGEQLKLIQPGDIYLYKSHTAIIATEPDNHSNITTLKFNRDIDTENSKRLGGSTYNYKLIDKAKEDANSPVYILRAKNLEPVHAELSLSYFLSKIDAEYINLYPEGPTEDIVGDCRIFFESCEQA